VRKQPRVAQSAKVEQNGMTFESDIAAYERWLQRNCRVVGADLAKKHNRMRRSAFDFLRCTYFRWTRRIETVCPELAAAPAVLAIGDIHLENYGTWRDAEGRFVWGVNDFDEAATMPYTHDLVRLAASALLYEGARFTVQAAAKAILAGYARGLAGPRPVLLDELDTWMRPLVACSDADRARFWRQMDELPAVRPPPAARAALKASLPEGAHEMKWVTRSKGGGSLGRPRYVAIAGWRGGHVVREAKTWVPSSWDWAHGNADPACRVLDVARGPFRAPDPVLDVASSYVVRRLSPDARKIELDEAAHGAIKLQVLEVMAFDLGAIHAATRGRVAAVRRDMEGRPAPWLASAAQAMARDVKADFETWRRLSAG
jgi:hypothetical protein